MLTGHTGSSGNKSVFFLDSFGCELLLTDLLQISHYIATKQLLFAQSESFYDDVEIRRASLSLLVVISKLCEYLAQHTHLGSKFTCILHVLG